MARGRWHGLFKLVAPWDLQATRFDHARHMDDLDSSRHGPHCEGGLTYYGSRHWNELWPVLYGYDVHWWTTREKNNGSRGGIYSTNDNWTVGPVG